MERFAKKIGKYKLEEFNVDEQGAMRHNALEKLRRTNRFIKQGKYWRLKKGKEVLMSNTPAELQDHKEFIQKALISKRVLINGLGLGMVIEEILPSKTLEEIIVIEKSKEVIKLMSPFIKDSRVIIVQADAYNYEPEGIFCAVWHDIWPFISTDNLSGMNILEEKYKPHTKWQGCWVKKECEQMRLIFGKIKQK